MLVFWGWDEMSEKGMHFDGGKLTFSQPFKAGGAHSDPLELQVLDGRLVGGAATAHHPSAAPAVVPSHCQLELHIAALRQFLSEKNPSFKLVT